VTSCVLFYKSHPTVGENSNLLVLVLPWLNVGMRMGPSGGHRGGHPSISWLFWSSAPSETPRGLLRWTNRCSGLACCSRGGWGDTVRGCHLPLPVGQLRTASTPFDIHISSPNRSTFFHRLVCWFVWSTSNGSLCRLHQHLVEIKTAICWVAELVPDLGTEKGIIFFATRSGRGSNWISVALPKIQVARPRPS